MIIDARQLALDAELEADVCVVGAGPIGIPIAQRLGRAGLSVILLDAGGVDFHPEVTRIFHRKTDSHEGYVLRIMLGSRHALPPSSFWRRRNWP